MGFLGLILNIIYIYYITITVPKNVVEVYEVY
jgi:hypothetical protein